MTTDDTLLVTWAELVEWSAESVDEIDGDQSYAERALKAAQDLAVRHLKGRSLFVRKYVEDWRNDSYITVAGESYPAMWARGWPVVEVDTANVELYTRDDEVRRIYATTVPDDDVTYYAGYKRSDQDLTALQALTGLSALGTAPADAPEWVLGGICEVAILLIDQATRGHISSNQVTQSIGQAETISVRLPNGQAEAILGKYLPMDVGVWL